MVAHGVEDPGDPVFNVYREDFDRLSEGDFVAFWCIYLTSLAYEQFIRGPRYAEHLANAQSKIGEFREACMAARIPDVKAPKSLRSVLAWTLSVVKTWTPRVAYRLPENQGEFEFGFSASAEAAKPSETDQLPQYIVRIRRSLEGVLARAGLSIWLTIDRLDEIFPRRSQTERSALRGLLRAMKLLSSEQIRVKVFLRDDTLDEIVAGDEDFVALTHIAARQADTLRWTEPQILTMVVKRLCANGHLREYLAVDAERLDASADYRQEVFYRVFPVSVQRGAKQSPTLKWIYARCEDGRGVVTPRDVLEMLVRAIQHQRDACAANLAGRSEAVIGSAALKYGLGELSTFRRRTFLQAEFPHLWPRIEKLIGGKTEYDESTLRRVFSPQGKAVIDDLVSIGVLGTVTRRGEVVYRIPFLYRRGLEVTQGKA